MARKARDPSSWLPDVPERPSFRVPLARWEGELPTLTDENRESILQAFGYHVRKTFGDEHISRWIAGEARDAIHLVDLARHTSSGLAVNVARDHIKDVDAVARKLLYCLRRLEATRALHELDSHGGTLAAFLQATLQDPGHKVEAAMVATGRDALLRVVARRGPLRTPWPGKLLPELWDNLEALRIEACYTLQQLRPDKTRQGKTKLRRSLVSRLADRWQQYFGEPPDARPNGLFMRVVREVAAVAEVTVSPPTVEAALRARERDIQATNAMLSNRPSEFLDD